MAGDARRADAAQLAERYTTAAEQLGHDKAAVRLAGVYPMARLADDWDEQRQVCIAVLCAYLRMPYEPDNTMRNAAKVSEKSGLPSLAKFAITSEIRTLQSHSVVVFLILWTSGDFSGAKFTGDVSFHGAKFTGGKVAGSFRRC